MARWVWAPCPLGNMFRNISEEEAVETDPRASKEGGEGSTRVDNRLSVGRMTISARMPARVPTRLCAGGRRVRNSRPSLGSAIDSIYFADATLASAFVARWCVGAKLETTGGVFQVREDEPAPRIGAGLHRTP